METAKPKQAHNPEKRFKAWIINYLNITLQNGEHMRIQVVAPDTFRIRLSAADDFREPALIRYGILDGRQRDAVCTVNEIGTMPLAASKGKAGFTIQACVRFG